MGTRHSCVVTVTQGPTSYRGCSRSLQDRDANISTQHTNLSAVTRSSHSAFSRVEALKVHYIPRKLFSTTKKRFPRGPIGEYIWCTEHSTAAGRCRRPPRLRNEVRKLDSETVTHHFTGEWRVESGSLVGASLVYLCVHVSFTFHALWQTTIPPQKKDTLFRSSLWVLRLQVRMCS